MIRSIKIIMDDGTEYDVRLDSFVTEPGADFEGTCEAYKVRPHDRRRSARLGKLQADALVREANAIVGHIDATTTGD